MRYLFFSLLIVFSSFISKANDIYFHDVKFDTGFINELKINDSEKDDFQKLTFVINVSKSTISVYERADYADALAKGFGALLGLSSIDDGVWEESDYFETSIKPHNIGSEMISFHSQTVRLQTIFYWKIVTKPLLLNFRIASCYIVNMENYIVVIQFPYQKTISIHGKN